MTDTLRSNLQRRQYRLAQALTVGGSLALGTLVVNRLVATFRDDFFLYYGVSDREYTELQNNPIAQLPFTLGQLVIAAIALVAVCVFVWSEGRRVRQACEIESACESTRNSAVVVERMSGASLFDAFVLRTSGVAALLLAIWLLQSSVERWLGGLGLGMEYADWRSLLPLASVFGVCVLAAMIVAAVSLVGLRAIHVLEYALARIKVRRTRRREVRPFLYFTLDTARTFRELLGCDILSRPPPVAC